MSEREELAGLLSSRNWDRQPLMNPQARWNAHADAILASDWLAARDARIRADIVAEVLGTIEFIAAICEAREMLAPGDRDIQTIKGIADAVLSTAKADE